jgi:hypothetical protein
VEADLNNLMDILDERKAFFDKNKNDDGNLYADPKILGEYYTFSNKLDAMMLSLASKDTQERFKILKF